jgi:hypothetical protein
MINKTKIAPIYAISNKIDGIDNDALHDLVFNITGNGHISQLTEKQADTVVKKLMSLERKVTKNGKISQGQIKKIFFYMYQLKWQTETGQLDTARLNKFVKRMTGTDNYKWLAYRQASNVIEGLKKLYERQGEIRGDKLVTAGIHVD